MCVQVWPKKGGDGSSAGKRSDISQGINVFDCYKDIEAL